MDVMLWTLIGLAGGLSIAALAPEMGLPTRGAVARRRVRGMASGLVGAVVAGYALVLAEPALRTDRLTAGLAGLAGALWVAGIVEVYASRRRRGEGNQPAAAPGAGLDAREMPAYDLAREALVTGLLEDAAAHDAGRYAEIGRGMVAVRAAVSRQDPASTPRLQLALRFWGGWSEACVDGPELTSPPAADWPRLARALAADLALDRDTRAPLILAGSDYAGPTLLAQERHPAGTPPAQPHDST